jgi:hypothetical protein
MAATSGADAASGGAAADGGSEGDSPPQPATTSNTHKGINLLIGLFLLMGSKTYGQPCIIQPAVSRLKSDFWDPNTDIGEVNAVAATFR